MTLSNDTRRSILLLQRIGMTRIAIAKRLRISPHSIDKYATRRKRLVVISDIHAGHRAGLTPPDWQWNIDNKFQSKWAQQQIETYDWYVERMESLQPIDYLLINGDAIEGKGPRSGGTELITIDRNEQIAMALESIRQAHAPKLIITKGTPYHTGIGEDWEDGLVKELRHHSVVEICDQAFPKIEGIQFHAKHFSGSSSIPHGRLTPLARSAMWNKLWAADRQQQPAVHVFIRSHVHYFTHCGERNWHAFSTPALHGWGSKFGQRKCECKIDTGLMWFDIPLGADCLSDIEWHVDIPDLLCHNVEIKQW